jgi:protein tyrosine/serine phosphatase
MLGRRRRDVTTDEFEGVVNFRDFGGAVGAGGRRVRQGRLFRAGHQAGATEADLERLAALELALLVDLRRPAERLRDVARRPAGFSAEVLEHQGPVENAVAPHLTFMTEPDATTGRVTEQMKIGYRGYPFDPHYVRLYGDYFDRLASVDGPVLIHCHAGKDRTGVLCALTLHVLGVGRDDIYADYLETNNRNRADARLTEMAEQFEQNYGRKVDEAFLRHVMSVQPDYLDAAFEAIEAEHGDVDAYLEQVLGVDAAARTAIRERLLA